MEKATVHLDWELAENNNITSSTGVVCHKDNEGLHILSTCHQLKPFADNDDYSTLVDKDFEITITFFDRGAKYTGLLCRFNMFYDLTLIKLSLIDDEFSTHPIPHVIPALFSKDPLYPRQAVYAIHHPEMTRTANNSREPLYFQQTTGHVVDLEYPVHGQPMRVHFEIDLVMSGSSGGPIFDQSSNKVLGMICGKVIGTTSNGILPTKRHYAISLDTVRNFLQSTHISV